MAGSSLLRENVSFCRKDKSHVTVMRSKGELDDSMLLQMFNNYILVSQELPTKPPKTNLISYSVATNVDLQ